MRRLLRKDWPSLGRKFGYGILLGINCGCMLHLFQRYIGGPKPAYGPSMLPTLAVQGELLLENNLSYWLNPKSIARGDLVSFVSPINPQRLACKRVIGLPGDVVCVDPTGEKAPSTEHVIVPKGHYWLSGDNAAASRDSRWYGPVSGRLIRGKVVAKIWPPRSWTVFRNPVSYID
ncbi:LexA/Signal peptidase [Neolentinus lepideus HHB14362 ss-1]|uniref:LexA/Signal peptidase n=1 Tax=Neolentinus lepideus HHB14362 ss-1 TaxID=1314782 RepID=A0A165PY82_9AGAM|nr:LexA/Signal peptidase [Neolentinus lepideus HHB14362 ss-1]